MDVLGISMAGLNAIARSSARPDCHPACCADGGHEPLAARRPASERAAMLRVDQAGEYGATRIYAGQFAVIRRNRPEAKLVARMAAQEQRHPPASTR